MACDENDIQPDGRIQRRGFVAGVGASVALAAAGLRIPSADAAQRYRVPGDLELREGTHIAARLSPDGRWIAVDLVGVLWVLPATGGEARRLTEDEFDVAQPMWSPDGSTLAFQSYREAGFDLWTIRADGGEPERLTEGPYDHREPDWSPDGKRLAFSSDAGGSYGVYTYDLATGTIEPVADSAEEEYEPAWSPDGSKLAFVVGDTRIDVVDLTSDTRTTAVTVPEGQVIHQPTWAPDGDRIVYHLLHDGRSDLYLSGEPLVTDEEAFPFKVSWIDRKDFLYTADGQLRRRALSGSESTTIPFQARVFVRPPKYRKRQRDFTSPAVRPVRGIGGPVLSPDGKRVAFRALNDIYTMPIGGRPEPLTGDTWWKTDPAWSPDGRQLAYSTDRAGKLDIWTRDLADGSDRQLTNLADAAALSPTWSPDGREIAFLDQTGAPYVVRVRSGEVRQIFPATFEPGRPTWSADGKLVALAAVHPYSARFWEGQSQILLVDKATGEGRYVEPMPHRSIQTRGDDGPVWSPDGSKLAFVVGSVLQVLDVEPDGTPVGPARQVTEEVTDAPSWSGDSRQLLYLHNGKLRLVSVDGGRPRTVPVPLTWANVQPAERIVVRAGRMWDGISQRLRSDVAILVVGHRIAAVLPDVGDRSWDGRVVDARDAVVVPGLIDMHHHREMAGYGYGDRQGRLWLSLGVTTTRSPGSPAYHMVEERESTQSGNRLGPRYFATGEAVDGPRIYYNFMRPTYDEAQLQLELERAAELDYDLLKAYVRLPVKWQRQVIRSAHRHGVPASSHYHYPAFAMGGDGMEHIGATNRFGYSRTVTELGTGYSDVIDIFAAARAARTPTLFTAVTLLREDTSLLEDRRVRTLYPSWEYAKLKDAADEAQNTDQTVIRADLRQQVRQVVEMVRGGGLVVLGTDSPIANNAASVHLNLRAMVKYGLTPYEAMVAATSAPGRFLAEPLGQISAGMYADLTILGGNPLTDIMRAADVRGVVAAGRVHTVDDLLAPYESGSRDSSVPPSPMLPPLEHRTNQRYWWHDPHYVESARHSCCTD